jgi:hypothetical protein
VVAIQVIDDFPIEKIDVLDGLLGQEAFTVEASGRARQSRFLNGAWISGTSPIHRTISAVMAWSKLDPWNFTRIEPIVVHNPYALVTLQNDTPPGCATYRRS